MGKFFGMSNPLNLIQMLALEFRWVPIVYYTMYSLIVRTMTAVFIELTAKSTQVGDVIKCYGLPSFTDDVQKQMQECIYGEYVVKLGDGTSACTTGAAITPLPTYTITLSGDVKNFEIQNILLLLVFTPFYFAFPLYLFVKGKGNWWGTSYDEDYLNTMTDAKMSLFYRRYLLFATTMLLFVAIWIIQMGFKNVGPSIISDFALGAITVLLALPPQRAKFVDPIDVEVGTKRLKQSQKGIMPKLKQITIINSDMYAGQMAHFNKAGVYKEAEAKSLLPNALQSVAFFVQCLGEDWSVDDLEDMATLENAEKAINLVDAAAPWDWKKRLQATKEDIAKRKKKLRTELTEKLKQLVLDEVLPAEVKDAICKAQAIADKKKALEIKYKADRKKIDGEIKALKKNEPETNTLKAKLKEDLKALAKKYAEDLAAAALDAVVPAEYKEKYAQLKATKEELKTWKKICEGDAKAREQKMDEAFKEVESRLKQAASNQVAPEDQQLAEDLAAIYKAADLPNRIKDASGPK